MKYYKFEDEFDWAELEKKVEEANKNDDSCWDLIELMSDSVIGSAQVPEEVDDVDEDVDGLYMEDGEEGDSVWCYVVHNEDVFYEFKYML